MILSKTMRAALSVARAHENRLVLLDTQNTAGMWSYPGYDWRKAHDTSAVFRRKTIGALVKKGLAEYNEFDTDMFAGSFPVGLTLTKLGREVRLETKAAADRWDYRR